MKGNYAKEIINEVERIARDMAISGEPESFGHPTIIGDHYEGVLNRLVIKKVFNKFNEEIYIFKGGLTIDGVPIKKQIDLILSKKEPTEIGVSSHYCCDYKDALAVIEVKKNLGKEEMIDSMNHLADIKRRILIHLSNNTFEFSNRVMHTAIKLAKMIAGSRIDLSPYYSTTIFNEIHLPVFATYGFFGYKTDNWFAKSYNEALNETFFNGDIELLPSIVACNEFSIFKGLAYPALVHNENQILTSIGNVSGIYSIIEAIFSKMSFADDNCERLDLFFNKDYDIKEVTLHELRFDINGAYWAHCGIELNGSRNTLKIQNEQISEISIQLYYFIVLHYADFVFENNCLFVDLKKGIEFIKNIDPGQALKFVMELSSLPFLNYLDGVIAVLGGIYISDFNDGYFISNFKSSGTSVFMDRNSSSSAFTLKARDMQFMSKAMNRFLRYKLGDALSKH